MTLTKKDWRQINKICKEIEELEKEVDEFFEKVDLDKIIKEVVR